MRSITISSFVHPTPGSGPGWVTAVRLTLLVTFLAAHLTSHRAALAADPPTESRTNYKLSATLDMSAASLDVTETIQFSNLTGRDLGSIVMHLPPAEIGGASISSVAVENQAGPAQVTGAVIE